MKRRKTKVMKKVKGTKKSSHKKEKDEEAYPIPVHLQGGERLRQVPGIAWFL
jgi:hypothetical protein